MQRPVETNDEVAWSLMDFRPKPFSVDESTAEDRARIVVDYLIEQAFKNTPRVSNPRRSVPKPSDTPMDLMGSLYF